MFFKNKRISTFNPPGHSRIDGYYFIFTHGVRPSQKQTRKRAVPQNLLAVTWWAIFNALDFKCKTKHYNMKLLL